MTRWASPLHGEDIYVQTCECDSSHGNVTALVVWLASLFSSSSCISWYIRIIGEKEADINHQWLRLLQVEAPATMAQIDVQIVSIQRPWKMFS